MYTITNEGHNFYNIISVNADNTYTCHKQGKFQAVFQEKIKRNWSKVGVYKLGPTCNVPVTIKKSDIAGKFINVDNYLITCPNHILNEQ